MGRLTVKDATKKEFVEFFTTSLYGKSGLWKFEQWLVDKRYKELDKKLGEILNLMDRENNRMYECSENASGQTEISEKIKWYNKACEHQKNWQELYEQSNKIEEEIDKLLEVN